MSWQFKDDAKSEEELNCQFKIDMRNFMNFDPSAQKPKTIALKWAAFDQSIQCLS